MSEFPNGLTIHRCIYIVDRAEGVVGEVIDQREHLILIGGIVLKVMRQ